MGTPIAARGARLLLSGMLCLLVSAPWAAETATLTLPQAIEISLRNNGELNAFRAETGIREAGKTRAALHPNPTLELEGSTGALTGSSTENSLSVGASQEILLGGKRGKRLAVAEQELAEYRWQLADRERLLTEAVKGAVHDVTLTEQRVLLADRAIQLNRQLQAVATERLAAGDIPELELNLVKVELARSEGAKIEGERSLHQNRAKLRALLGLAAGETLAISSTFTADSPMTKSLAELQLLAQGNRPDLRAMRIEKSRYEADIDLARAEGIPNLTAGLAITRDTTTMEIGGIEGKDTGWTVGLKLSLPLPLFDRNQAGIQEASARHHSSESRLTAANGTIELEVTTAHAGFLQSENVLALYRKNIIPQLEENLSLTHEAYRLGEVGILAVIEEQKKFFEVSDGYLAAQHGRQMALVKLESAVATELTGGTP